MLHTFYFNPYRECTYILWDESSPIPHPALIIDAGMYEEKEGKRFADYISKENLCPKTLLITHTHPDHICGVDFMRKTYGLEPIIAPKEGALDISFFPGLEVISTPGHKEDCVCYYFPKKGILFSGDTLFQESIGRTDLPGGDLTTLIKSLKKLSSLPDETIVYPGHGYTTTIAHEKQYNPYL